VRASISGALARASAASMPSQASGRSRSSGASVAASRMLRRWGARALDGVGGAGRGKVVFAGQQVVDDRGAAEDVGPRADASRVEPGKLRRCEAGRADEEAPERRRDARGPRQAEVRDLEQLVIAEAAAEDVVRLQIAVDDRHLVDGGDALRERFDGMRGAAGIERRARLLDGIRDALRERRPLRASVHVLEREPGDVERAFPAFHAKRPRVDEAHDERRRRHPLVQAPERDCLLLHHHRGRGPGIRHERRPQDLHDGGCLPLRRQAQREERRRHPPSSDRAVEAVRDAARELGGQDGASQRADHPFVAVDAQHASS